MAETIPIRPADLLIDEENPRISLPNVGQHKAQQAVAHHQQRKLQRLARDIVRYGPDPSELPIVMPLKDDLKRYVVLEGNRRLVALRALENPDSLGDAVSKGILDEIRRLSREYQQNPVEHVQCLVVKNKEEARHWIELRHTGENEGAGVVPWGADERARFNYRHRVEVHQQALNFLEQRGDLTAEARRKIPTTSFKRLMETREVRSKLGVEVHGGILYRLADPRKVARALLYVVNDLASRTTKVKDIYTKPQRVQYASEIPTDVVVTPTAQSGHGMPVGSGAEGTEVKPTAGPKLGRERDRLIPRDCVLNVTDARLHKIEIELRRLSLNDFTNAVSVLFRVFLELSADAYIDSVQLPMSTERDSLAKKLTDVTSDLVSRRKLTVQQAGPVRHACQKDSFLGPSITLMHNYVHNRHMFPAAGDLRPCWDSLQPFIIAVWAP